MLLQTNPETGNADIKALPLEGEREARLLVQTEFPFRRILAEGAALSPDGRFLMIEEVDELPEPAEVHVVLNWFEELKRLVPTR